MSQAIVSLRGVTKHYTRGKQTVEVLQPLDLSISQGDFLALMGPSGSGKTTLLNLIGGLDQPSSGEVNVGGQRIDQLSSAALAQWRSHHVGFVFQFYNLLGVLSAVIAIGALWLLFLSLTPSAYRANRYPKWPGALFVSLWWLTVSILLPKLLATVFSYDLTYGSLAGVMIALFFFWLVGIGMVIGAELNAALAETPEEHDMLGQADNRARAIRQAGVRKPE